MSIARCDTGATLAPCPPPVADTPSPRLHRSRPRSTSFDASSVPIASSSVSSWSWERAPSSPRYVPSETTARPYAAAWPIACGYGPRASTAGPPTGPRLRLGASVTAELRLDNSAWARLDDPSLPRDRVEEIASALEEGRIAVCLPFLLEAGYSARHAAGPLICSRSCSRSRSFTSTRRSYAAPFRLSSPAPRTTAWRPVDLILAAGRGQARPRHPPLRRRLRHPPVEDRPAVRERVACAAREPVRSVVVLLALAERRTAASSGRLSLLRARLAVRRTLLLDRMTGGCDTPGRAAAARAASSTAVQRAQVLRA